MHDKDDFASECGKNDFSLNTPEIIGIHMGEGELNPHIMKRQFQGTKYLHVCGGGSKTISFYKKNRRMTNLTVGVGKDFLYKAKKKKSSNYKEKDG